VQFIETPVFARALQRLLDDDTYRSLQLALLLRPEHGTLVQGGGGIRKMRWAARGRGRRGGVRLVYYWSHRTETFYMLYIYSKTEQRDLTSAQLQTLARLVRQELK
jgi:hypothetical protein